MPVTYLAKLSSINETTPWQTDNRPHKLLVLEALSPSPMATSSLPRASMRRLEGKVAIITGGASGIGESTARLFVRHGAKVVIADIQDDLGHSICEDIKMKEAISYVHCDVSSESDVQNVVDVTVAKYGRLDIMFSNAGVSDKPGFTILDINYEEFKKVIDVNVYGAFLCAKHAARVMIPAKKGSIIFTSSVASVVHGGIPHAYTASKHALVGITKNLCVELGKHGIRVNCISPFSVATPLVMKAMGTTDKKEIESFVSRAANLKEVVLEAEDVAHAALYLGSDESKYVSGINLVLDGGYSTTNIAMKEEVKKMFCCTNA